MNDKMHNRNSMDRSRNSCDADPLSDLVNIPDFFNRYACICAARYNEFVHCQSENGYL